MLWLLAIIPLCLCGVPEFDASAIHLPTARCDFSVHKDGPDGELVSGTNLEVKLFYDISCKPEKGYCLNVANCTVSGDGPGSTPYPIIDGKGCTTESSLFGNVEYRGDFQAGIPNPYPIRFRGASSSVLFFCVTTMTPREGASCTRPACPPVPVKA